MNKRQIKINKEFNEKCKEAQTNYKEQLKNEIDKIAKYELIRNNIKSYIVIYTDKIERYQLIDNIFNNFEIDKDMRINYNMLDRLKYKKID